MAIANIDGIKLNQTYTFTPPEGEYPGCVGRCTVLRINGFMLGLQQVEDKKYPMDVKFDARGEKKETPRQIGKQAWVRFTSYATIE